MGDNEFVVVRGVSHSRNVILELVITWHIPIPNLDSNSKLVIIVTQSLHEEPLVEGLIRGGLVRGGGGGGGRGVKTLLLRTRSHCPKVSDRTATIFVSLGQKNLRSFLKLVPTMYECFQFNPNTI